MFSIGFPFRVEKEGFTEIALSSDVVYRAGKPPKLSLGELHCNTVKPVM